MALYDRVSASHLLTGRARDRALAVLPGRPPRIVFINYKYNMEQDPVVHFELAYEDKQRAADFYSKAFGWKPQMMGADMGEYIVMQTADTDEKGMIKEPGR